jgi:hypothetical protein
MDSLNNYRQLIKSLLNDYAELENRPPKDEIETQVVCIVLAFPHPVMRPFTEFAVA